MPPNLQDFAQTILTNMSLQPPSTTAAPGQFTINMLPSEVLLKIFSCYVEESHIGGVWHTLAYVCRRWRNIALDSPLRLNIRIFCLEFASKASEVRQASLSLSLNLNLKKKLEFWPPFPTFPIALRVYCFPELRPILREDNVLATLEHHDRICDINLMEFSISYGPGMKSVVPGSFLGGSAP